MTSREVVEARIREVNEELNDLSDSDLLERGVQLFHEVVDVYLDEERNVCGALECVKRGTSKCSGCNVRHYCGGEHQKEHWKVHKKECKELKGMASLREASREYCERWDAVTGCSDEKARKKLRKEERKAKEKLERVVSERVDMTASITDDAMMNKLEGLSSVLIKLTFLSYVIDGHKALRRAFVIDALRHAAIIATVRGLEKEKAVVLRAIGVELARRVLTKKELCWIFSYVAGALQDGGLYFEAMIYRVQELSLVKVCYGEDHQNVAATLNNMAIVHKRLGEYEMAMSKYEEALKIKKAVFGDQHEDVALTLNNMANVHYSLGEYEMAMSKYEEALKIDKAVFGDQHENVAATLSNMAGVHQSLGEYEMAMSKYEEALKIRKAVFGDQHESVAMTLNNMAVVHSRLGEYEMAMSKYEEALKIQKAVFVDQHENVATTLNNMALVHKSLGKYEMAMSKYEEALKIKKAVFGDQHEDVAMTLNNMAGVHRSLGEYEMAMRKNKMAFDIYQRNEDHRHALQSLCACAWNQILSSGNAISDDLEKLPTYFKKLNNEISGASSMSLGKYRLLVERMSDLALCDGQSGASILLDAAEHLTQAPLLAIRMQFLRSAVHVSGDVSDRCRSLTALATCLSESGLYLRALEHAQEAVALGGGVDAENLFTSIDKKLKNRSKLVDMDIFAQLERLQEGWMELQMQIVDDLRENTSSILSSFARNRTTELLVGASNLLDHAYSRLVRRPLGDQAAKPKDTYFEIASSKQNFTTKMISSKLSGVAPCTLDGAGTFAFQWDSAEFLQLLRDVNCWISRSKSGDVMTIDLSKLIGDSHWEKGGKFAWCKDVLKEIVEEEEVKKSRKKAKKSAKQGSNLLPGKWTADGLVAKVHESLFESVTKDLRDAGLIFGDKKNPPWWNIAHKDAEKISCLIDYVELDTELLKTGQHLPLREWRRDVPGLEEALLAGICSDVKRPDPNLYVDFVMACPKSWKLLQEVQSYTAWDAAEVAADDAAAKALARVGTWLVKMQAIANDAKHLRLTPQSVNNALRSERRLLPERDVKVMVDYLEHLPQLYDWSFFDVLSSTRTSEYTFKELSEASRVLRYKAFGNYFEKKHYSKVPFDRLAHRLAREVLRTKGKDRQAKLDEFEKIVRADVAQCKNETWKDGTPCMNVDAFADDAWSFIRARTLRLDPLQSLSMLEPDFRIDVYEFIPKVLEEVRRLALTFGEEQVEGGIPEEDWSGHVLSKAECKLNEAATRGDTMSVCGDFQKVASTCIETIKGGAVDVVSVSALFDAVRILASAYSFCAHWEEAGVAWIDGANVLESHADAKWWWLVARMREKAVRCLLLPAKMTANAKAYRAQQQLSAAYEKRGLFEHTQLAYSKLSDIGMRAMEKTDKTQAERPGDRSLEAVSKRRELFLDKKRGHIDKHVYDQLQHCRSQLLELRYEAFRVAVAGYDRRRLLRALCLASEIAVKCRHLLDQALTRFGRICIGASFGLELISCKFPMTGNANQLVNKLVEQLVHFGKGDKSKEKEKKQLVAAQKSLEKEILTTEETARLKEVEKLLAVLEKKEAEVKRKEEDMTNAIKACVESTYADVLSAVQRAQTFWFVQNKRWEERWLDELVRWTNELKHVRMQVPSEEDLLDWREKDGGLTNGFLFIQLCDDRFYEWSFAFDVNSTGVGGGGGVTVGESAELLKALKHNKVLNDKGSAEEEDETKIREKVTTALRTVRGDACDETKLMEDCARVGDRLMQHVRREPYSGERIGLEGLLQRSLDAVENVVSVLYDAIGSAQLAGAAVSIVDEHVAESSQLFKTLRDVKNRVDEPADTSVFDRLGSRLRANQLEVDSVAADGKCQYHALAKVITAAHVRDSTTGTALVLTGDQVLSDVIGWLRDNEAYELENGAKLVDFCVEGHTWTSYCDLIATPIASDPTTWGDHLTLVAASVVYGVSIVIVRDCKDDDASVVLVSMASLENAPTVVIALRGQMQYSATITIHNTRDRRKKEAKEKERARVSVEEKGALNGEGEGRGGYVGAPRAIDVTSLLKSGDLCASRSEYAHAMLAYEKALGVQKMHGALDQDLALTLIRMAELHLKTGELSLALNLYEEALKKERQVLGEEHERVAASLRNVASVHRLRGEYGRSLELLRNALEIEKKLSGEKSLRVASTLQSIAGLYEEIGELERAADLYEQALLL